MPEAEISDRIAIVERNLDAYLETAAPAPPLGRDAPLRPGGRLLVREALALFEDQMLSRAIDVAARRLKLRNLGFYTISSAGHEQNACLGALLRIDDPCFLHYRAGALMMARARKLPGATPLFDTLLSICASKEDPIAEGRHKVWGSRALWVPPQTSTIASHLPKATGMAFALARARRLGIDPCVAHDAIVCCTFGDASANHATALSGIHAARYAHRRGAPVPILFVCEDNGIGISVETPRRWIGESFGSLPHLQYVEAEGDLAAIHDATAHAVDLCRASRAPVFLRLACVRLWGHAGTDIETAYRTQSEIEASETIDPLLANARLLVETGAAAPEELRAIVADTRARVAAAAEEAPRRPHLSTREEVMRPLAPYDEPRCRASAQGAPSADERRAIWGDDLPERAKNPMKRTLASHINAALADEMARRKDVLVFGEDVGKKGGVYYVTAGLQKRFGVARCFDTQLDETSILGVAQGLGHAGMLPVPEIQYLAYLHNAVDQIRGEACSLSFFSNGQFTNPMVVRLAGLAYQKGFGGHFHNDNSFGGIRDIPGLVLAVPSRGDDAARILRGCLAIARECGRVVVFLEPIALYHEKDLYEDGDGLWLSDYPAPGSALLPGEVGGWGEGNHLIVSYANGYRLSLRAARTLEREHGIRCRVLDLRWLSPLPFERIREEAARAESVTVVDECRATGGGIAEAVLAHLAESGCRATLRSVRAADTYVPLGPPARTVLVQEEEIVEALLRPPAPPHLRPEGR